MDIKWIGHSCFKVDGPGYSVVFDPYADGYVPGLGPVSEAADLVICSHQHGDHNAKDNVDTSSARDLSEVLKITEIHTYHDDTKGSQRGENTITIINDGTESLAHFGDLGCDLTEEEAALLSNLDYALIPVGGFYTIDWEMAIKILCKINPKVVIPMHFRNDPLGFGFDVIDTVEPFVSAMEMAAAQGLVQSEVRVLTPTNLAK